MFRMEPRWLALLEVLQSDARQRAELEAAAQLGKEPLIAAFQALGARAGHPLSRAEVVDLLCASARGSRAPRGELQDEQLERVTGGTDDEDAQLAGVDLQGIVSSGRLAQTIQGMSNINKLSYDTAQSVIRKMGG